MAFNFLMSARDDGIIFTYHNRQKAIYVFQVENTIYEQEVLTPKYEDDIFENQFSFFYLYFSILSFLTTLLMIFPKIFNTILYLKIFAIVLIFYFCYTIIHILYDAKKYSYTLKQYHSAEHMIFNANTTEISVEDLRKASKYSNYCGSNEPIINILKFTFIAFYSIPCSHMLHFVFVILPSYISINNIFVFHFILICCLYATLSLFYHILVWEMNNIEKVAYKDGLFNHIIQPLFLEEPTDEQLELAICGMQRVKELEDALK